MKRRIAGIAMIILPLMAGAQTNPPLSDNHFMFDAGQISWQKVYQTEYIADALISAVLESGIFEKVLNQTADRISGEVSPIHPMTKEAGYSPLTVHGLAAPGTQLRGILTYEFKDGKYRVSFGNIKWFLPGTPMLSQGFVPIETNFTKKGEINHKQFREDVQAIYNHTFDHYFEIKAKPADNW